MNATTPVLEQFRAWADAKGLDLAYTYDTERSRHVWLNPFTADLWEAWQAGESAYRQQAAEPALKPVGDVVVLRRKRDGGVSRLSRIMDRPKDLESCLLHWRDTYTDELWDIEVCRIFSKSKAPV